LYFSIFVVIVPIEEEVIFIDFLSFAAKGLLIKLLQDRVAVVKRVNQSNGIQPIFVFHQAHENSQVFLSYFTLQTKLFQK
jgi:hypothetical protein